MSCWPDKVYLFTASVLGCSMYSLLSRYVLFLFCMFAHTCRGHWTYMAAPSWLPQGLFYPCIWSGLSYLVLISAFLYIFDWWICVHYFPNNIFFFFQAVCFYLSILDWINMYILESIFFRGSRILVQGFSDPDVFKSSIAALSLSVSSQRWTYAGEVVEK